MKYNRFHHTLGSLCEIKKGTFPIMKTLPGRFPFVVTGANLKTADNYDFDCEAVCIPLVSSTGHGNAAMHRVHYIKGKFALSNLLCAIIPKRESQLDSRFLLHLLMAKKEEYFVPLMKGTSNVSISTRQIGTVTIALPPLNEQKRITLTIDTIKSKLDQIKALRNDQNIDLNKFLFSKYIELIENAEWLPMKEVAPINRRQVEVNPEETYFEIGVRSFGRGLFENPSFVGAVLTWQKPFWMKEGDLLFSNIKAWEGAVGLIPKEYDGWVGSHRYITCVPNVKLINPEFIFYYFRTQEGVEKLSLASSGTADRNRTLNTKMLHQIFVPVPDITLQEEFVDLLHQVGAIKEQHSETEKELTELMPALLDKAFKGEM